MIQLNHLLLHLIFTLLTTTSTFDLGCREYERCLQSMPDETTYRCEEIAHAWKDIYMCLSKARCDDHYYGAGLVLGRCLSLHNYYTRIQPQCGWDDDRDHPDFPKDPLVFCGTKTIPEFKPSFVNATAEKSCGEMFYPRTCEDSYKMEHYMNCVWEISTNRFTEGLIRGGCQYFTDQKGRKCAFSERVCSADVVENCRLWLLLLAAVVVFMLAG